MLQWASLTSTWIAYVFPWPKPCLTYVISLVYIVFPLPLKLEYGKENFQAAQHKQSDEVVPKRETRDNNTFMFGDDYYGKANIVSILKQKINTIRYEYRNCQLHKINNCLFHNVAG